MDVRSLYKRLAIPVALLIIVLLLWQVVNDVREIPITTGLMLALGLLMYVVDDVRRK